MAEFWIQGPIEDRATFWRDNDSVAWEKGCYIFAFRAGRGTKPVYVGKATKSFRQEIFTHHKLSLYHSALADQKRGAPVIFFVCQTTPRNQILKQFDR